jgi:TolB-like protein
MESARSDELASAEPSAEDVQIQLRRILASESLRLPERARRFLEYVVEETLAGRSHYLKAYSIAETVFGRQNFDAQSDPAVRIEAGRIRRELERYYLLAGCDEPVIITIPKGGYVPTFTPSCALKRADAQSSQETLHPAIPDDPLETKPAGDGQVAGRRVVQRNPWLLTGGLAIFAIVAALGASLFLRMEWSPRDAFDGDGLPTVAVEPFNDVADDNKASVISQGLTDEVIAKLVKFREILVVDVTAAPHESDVGLGKARYALQGTVRRDGERMRSTIRLVRRSDGAVIWANNYDADFRVQSIFEAETALAEKIATAVAQPFGVLFRNDSARDPSASGDWVAYDCVLSYYSYRREMTAQALKTAQTCLRTVTAKSPHDATSLAFLSMTYLDQSRFAYQLGTEPSTSDIETASRLAKQAAAIDPQNARVLQALMLASFFGNDVSAALEAGAAAYQLNPNDTEVAGEYGLRLSMSGRWDTGCDLLSKAVSEDAGPHGYYEIGMALCAFTRGDLQAAELWCRMSDLNLNPMHRLILTSILGAAGKTDEAKMELAWLNSNAPRLVANIRHEVATRLVLPADQERIFAGLRAGGAIIESAKQPPMDQRFDVGSPQTGGF